jgi:ribosomal protein L7/L12
VSDLNYPMLIPWLLWFVLMGSLTLIINSVDKGKSMTERRLTRLERKVDAIMRHLDVEEPRPDLAEVRTLLDQGKKIQAIKVYRQMTGIGLKEAKMAVEAIEQGLPVS